MVNMKIDHFVVGPVETNCYFVTNMKTKELIIIDPGACAKHAKPLADKYGIKIYIHEDDRETLGDPQLNASWMMGQSKTFHADEFLKDQQELDIAGFHIIVIHTPGHTPGGCCYYFPYEDVIFTGDSLFCGSIGRTDFKKGSMSDLVRSVKEKVMTLPGHTDVYPGHNDTTTIDNERMYNPYL